MILCSREFSQPRDRTQVYRTAGRFLTVWATREAQSPRRTLYVADLKQHRFELCRPTYTWIAFFSSEYYNTTQSLVIWIQEWRTTDMKKTQQWRANFKLYTDFQLCRSGGPQPPCCSRVRCTWFVGRTTWANMKQCCSADRVQQKGTQK